MGSIICFGSAAGGLTSSLCFTMAEYPFIMVCLGIYRVFSISVPLTLRYWTPCQGVLGYWTPCQSMSPSGIRLYWDLISNVEKKGGRPENGLAVPATRWKPHKSKDWEFLHRNTYQFFFSTPKKKFCSSSKNFARKFSIFFSKKVNPKIADFEKRPDVKNQKCRFLSLIFFDFCRIFFSRFFVFFPDFFDFFWTWKNDFLRVEKNVGHIFRCKNFRSFDLWGFQNVLSTANGISRAKKIMTRVPGGRCVRIGFCLGNAQWESDPAHNEALSWPGRRGPTGDESAQCCFIIDLASRTCGSRPP